MRTRTRPLGSQPAKRFFVLSALAGAIASGIIGCGGGAAGTVTSDKEAPAVLVTPNGGTFLRAPNVADCTDNFVCDAVAYTLDGSEPAFSGAGSTVTTGRTTNVQLSANTTVTLKYRAHDAAGNLSEIKTAAFTIGCPTPGQLPNAAGGCINPAQVDITRDGTPDGFDFDGNGVPEVLFLGGTPRGLDLDGDGVANFYLTTDANGLWSMSAQADGTGPVRVVTTSDQSPIGFDTNDDGANDNDIFSRVIADAEAPTISISPGAGNYAAAQNAIVTCGDGIACDAIAYTLDGSEPSFSNNGIVVPGKTVSIPLALNTTPRVRAVARDAKGNSSPLADASYRVGCPSNPVAKAGADLEFTIGEPAHFDGSASTTSNGTIASYKWSQLAAGNAPTMGLPFTTAAPQFTAPSSVTTLRYQLEVTDSNNCKATDQVLAFVMRDKTRAVFVNGDSGSDTAGDGSRAKPWKTLAKGVTDAAAVPASPKDVYAATLAGNANYTETNTLTVPAEVSLFGGFNSQWISDPENNRTAIQGASTAVDVTVGTTRTSFLAGFNIKAAQPSTNSSTDSFAVKVHGTSTTGTSFTSRHNTLTAGNVGDGVTGVATPGSSYGLYASTVQTVVVENSNVSSGKGGKGIAGNAGAAGTPGIPGITATTIAGVAGGASPDLKIIIGGGTGGNGGAPLLPGVAGAAGLGNTGVIDGKGGLVGPVGSNGGNGNDGTVGSSGAAATVAGTGIGSLSATGFHQTSNGSTGINGGHGGGGGGGAGGSGGTLFLTPPAGSGGGGGGGGSGGIGSSGGAGGIGGGASFGLFVDKVKTLSVALKTTVATNQGGNAGAGGVGGVSSIGGKGGDGVTGGARAGKGGTGGKGGNGGAGGDGAGGGGGPSIGIYVGAQVEATIDNTATITVGNGGAGGNTRNGAGGQGGNVFGVFDADPATTKPAVANPAGITLGIGGTGGLKEAGGTGTVGTQGTAKATNW